MAYSEVEFLMYALLDELLSLSLSLSLYLSICYNVTAGEKSQLS